MENKLYKEFLSLFLFLPEAGSIISEDNAFHDELKLKLISDMQQAIEKIISNHQPNESLFDEIKDNLLLNTLDKRRYLISILSDFKDISAYLNISTDKEYCSFCGLPALKIGDIYYSEYHISIHKLLERYCRWIEPVLEYDKSTMPEKYITQCFHAYNSFFLCLDELCLVFQMNLAAIQNEIGLQIFERNISNQPQEIRKPELSINQIALKFVYDGLQITRANGNEIAHGYGHNSGEKLFQRFTYYSSSSNRKGRPSPHSNKKLENKIKLIESIIELLPKGKQNKAIDEVSILKTYFDNEYQ